MGCHILKFALLSLVLFFSVSSQGECSNIKHNDVKIIYVAAASSMTFALNDISALYKRKKPNTTLRISYSSSGNLFAKIKEGAPYDIFLSADDTYTQQLLKANIGLPHSRKVYAKGGLVLLLGRNKATKKLYNGFLKSTSPKTILSDARLNKIAIANPKHAPYGKAAKKWLTGAQLWLPLRSKFIYADNANGVAQYTQTLADVGITASSLVYSPRFNKQTLFSIPIKNTRNIKHEMLILKKSQQVEHFWLFLLSKPVQNILKKHGLF